MKQLVTEALHEKLATGASKQSLATPGWMKYFGTFGKTAQMRADTRRIQQVIDREFESVDAEDA